MENSALTRQATRARIGPWYVMQSRNPSAPGMKCNTLLALIRKGQVTPRSVIRGPTTFQLWRFAARVKGISREFGLCYSCGAELQRTSTFCPRCSRSQELPPNPDVLLETEPQAGKAVYRDVTPRRESPVDVVRSETPTSAPPQATSPVESEPARPGSQIPSAAETMAQLADLPSPENASADLQTRPRQRQQEGVLTPRELAAAFSLQYDPTMDGSTRARKGSGGKNLLVAALVLLVIGGGAATFYFVPTLRQRFMAWVQDSSPPPVEASAPQKIVPDKTVPWMMGPDDTPPITTPAKPVASGAAHASDAPVPTTPQPSPVIASAPPPVQVAQQQPVATQPPATAPPMIDAPVTTSTPLVADPRTNAAAETVAKLRHSTAGDLDDLAMELRSNGLDAEHRQDFAAAQYYYEQVKALPSDHWPSDIDFLLKDVQKRTAASLAR